MAHARLKFATSPSLDEIHFWGLLSNRGRSPMLYEFLTENKKEILATAAKESLILSGSRPTSLQLEAGLPIFFAQLLDILELQEKHPTPVASDSNKKAAAVAAVNSNEVEDECGGLALNAEYDLFKPFEQHNNNRLGLGLGINIARKAIELQGGFLNVRNLPSKGCVFIIQLPKSGEKTSLVS